MKNIDIIDVNGMGISITPGNVVTTIVIFAVVAVTFYLLRSFGLYSMAKRLKIKNAGLSFVPCLWLYVVCKLIGNARFFNRTFESLATVFAVLFVFSTLLPLTVKFLAYFPLVGYYLQGGEVIICVGADAKIIGEFENYLFVSDIYVNHISYPYANISGVGILLNLLSMASNLFGLIETVILVFVFINLFKELTPRHYVLPALLSFFGLFGLFIFVNRKKSPVNYLDYLRAHGYYTVYNPYISNPYNERPTDEKKDGGNQGEQSAPKDEDPFSDFFGDK